MRLNCNHLRYSGVCRYFLSEEFLIYYRVFGFARALALFDALTYMGMPLFVLKSASVVLRCTYDSSDLMIQSVFDLNHMTIVVRFKSNWTNDGFYKQTRLLYYINHTRLSLMNSISKQLMVDASFVGKCIGCSYV